MKSFTNQRFRELFAELPAQVQRHAREAYRQFRENPSYPGLSTSSKSFQIRAFVPPA